jgi:hypothetical protein
MYKSPFVIDPTKIGPFDRCLVCFTKRDEPICKTCGHIGGYLAITDKPQSGIACTFHPDVSATTFCVYCGKPICASCVERDGIGLLTGPLGMDGSECRACHQKAADLEKAYHERLEAEKVCAKHSNDPAALRCIKCRLLHCESCLYFTTTGWIRKRLGIGPLCLGCFRSNATGNARQSWISLREAKARELLRGVDPISLL